jgi:hypothetical protein
MPGRGSGTAPVNPQLYLQLMRDGSPPEGESSFYFTFTGPAMYTEASKFKKLDFKDSVDGSSPDAQCIFKCYERALDELDKRLGQHLNGGTWRKALVNSSLDGASVNLGQHRGVGKLLGDAVPMQVTLHAAAHIVQLCVSDVFELCEYHVFFKELVARLCREYSESG